MLRHHPRPQHVGSEPDSLAGVDNRAEIGLFALLKLSVGFSLVKPIVQKLFKLTPSGGDWWRHTFPGRGEIKEHHFLI